MRYHPPVLKVDSPRRQLWGWLENAELPFATAALLGDLRGPGQQQTQTMAELVPIGGAGFGLPVPSWPRRSGREYQLGCLKYLRC